MDKIEDYQALLYTYHQGMYTQGEVVSKSIELLFQSNDRAALWNAFESEHSDYIAQLLNNFDRSTEPFAIKASAIQVWREMSALKQWFDDK